MERSSNLPKWQARDSSSSSGSLALEPTCLSHFAKHSMTELGAWVPSQCLGVHLFTESSLQAPTPVLVPSAPSDLEDSNGG